VRKPQESEKGIVLGGCTLCTIASASPDELRPYDRPIIETEHFIVIPALGHFVDGYLLICTRRHYKNLGETDAAVFDDFLVVKNRVTDLLSREYRKRPIFFEHGPVSETQRAGSCVVHAHMHAIPILLPAPPDYVTRNLQGGNIRTIEEVRKCVERGQAYFFLECSDGSMFLYNESVLPCQYGRQIVAQHIGLDIDKYDWHLNPEYERAAATWKKLSQRPQKR
jgi:diadenosine tetraphosphate (Ap4A) HIT family hydrolase